MTHETAAERLDYLPGNKRTIYQRADIFSYSMDAVLLAKFVRLPKNSSGKVMDLCAGTGAVPLIMSLRTKAVIDAVELQPLLAELAAKSAAVNGLDKHIRVIEADLTDLQALTHFLEMESYDAVTCNPPYFPVTAEKSKSLNNYKCLARHEVSCTLRDVIGTAAKLVKQKGKVALVHRPERLPDIFAAMKTCRLEPKRLQYVHPKKHQEANMVLVEAVREGNPGLKTEAPWIVYNETGKYTKEFQTHYER